MENLAHISKIEAFRDFVKTIAERIDNESQALVKVHKGPDIAVIYVFFQDSDKHEILNLLENIKKSHANDFAEISICRSEERTRRPMAEFQGANIKIHALELNQVDMIFQRKLSS